MSSVIFSTIGQAVGGPLGGAAAAMAGSALDLALAGRRRRYRVPEFRAPTSAYGDPVPEIYGVSRVSGVLIWALPFARSGASKGGTSDRSAFTASFAIALSARPIERIGRIWADGRLIRDAEGVFGIACSMRLYRGVPDQKVDPLIAAAEGLETCPAYRQLAYVVFEDFPLASFGNRIPALSFEVHADAGPPVASTWLRDHLRRSGVAGARCDASTSLQGYAALGPSAREDAEALGAFLGVRPVLDGAGVHVRRAGHVWTIPAEELGARRQGESPEDGPKPTTAALSERVSNASVAYLDPERDFLRGAQTFGVSQGSGPLELAGPFSATAAEALRSAETLYRDATAAVERLELALSWDWLSVLPNDLVQVAGDGRTWRVVEKLVEGCLVRLKCEAVAEGAGADAATDPGRLLPAPVDRLAPTRLAIVEPPVGWSSDDPPGLQVFALARDGWNSAAIGWGTIGEDRFSPLGVVRTGMAHGTLAHPLATGPSTLWDERNRLDLIVEAGEEQLLTRSLQAVLDGANLVRVGGELIQFRVARPAGENRVELSGLLRGRLATLARDHDAGTPWHLVQPWAAATLGLQPDWIGREILVQAVGSGDPAEGSLSAHVVSGASISPLAPCHLSLVRTGANGLRLQWIARDRSCVDWNAAGNALPKWHRAVLHWTGGSLPQPLILRAFGDGVDLPAEVVLELRAIGARTLRCEVLAEGDGPADMRSSGSRELPV